MIEETVSRAEAYEAIIRKSFEACKEPNDYVAITRLLILKEQEKNALLHELLHQIGETAALANVGESIGVEKLPLTLRVT
jgi:hypothetical protein